LARPCLLTSFRFLDQSISLFGTSRPGARAVRPPLLRRDCLPASAGIRVL